MNFEYTDKVKGLIQQVQDFMDRYIYPVEQELNAYYTIPENFWTVHPKIEELKELAKSAGLWNLFLPKEYGELSPGLTNLEYAPLAELMGRCKWASEIFNCSAPDTGNMEVLAKYMSDAYRYSFSGALFLKEELYLLLINLN